MANNDIFIQNQTNTKRFNFRAVLGYKVRKIQPVINVPLINNGPENNILYRFVGQVEEITFNFVLFNDGNDVSGLTADNIVTVKEQVAYLKDQIYTEEFETFWTMYDIPGVAYTSSAPINCVITSLDIDFNQNAENYAVGSITIQRGRIGLL